MTTRLKAIACPYGALNHNGHAQARVQIFDAPPGRCVGAALCLDMSKAHKVAHYRFSEEPVEIVCSDPAAYAHYRRAFEDGDLIAADEATAKKLALGKFRDPKAVLAERRDRAIAEWKAQHGEAPELHAPELKAPETDEPAPTTDSPADAGGEH